MGSAPYASAGAERRGTSSQEGNGVVSAVVTGAIVAFPVAVFLVGDCTHAAATRAITTPSAICRIIVSQGSYTVETPGYGRTVRSRGAGSSRPGVGRPCMGGFPWESGDRTVRMTTNGD
ncbi:MAG: hypothetical protein ACC683_09150 [Acidimicrobiia bacterium]